MISDVGGRHLTEKVSLRCPWQNYYVGDFYQSFDDFFNVRNKCNIRRNGSAAKLQQANMEFSVSQNDFF